jgi:predicted nucleotidyltransferase
MSSEVQRLHKLGLLNSPKWLPNNTQYEVIMGSMAYGVSTDYSDLDIYGFAIPPIGLVFPHLEGEIPGFGRQIQRFDQYQEHHIEDASARGGKGQEYDFSIYGIVKYFKEAMAGAPNLIDSLFVPQNCILHATHIGQMVREHRHLFLHKGLWHSYKGYAFQQMKKIKTKNPVGKRVEMVEKFGFDVKYAYHLVRLLNEIEQILTEHDLDLLRNREQLKAIRRGDWSQQDIEDYFAQKERDLETMYTESEIPWGPDEKKIKALLLDCLEHHYGSISEVVRLQGDPEMLISDIKGLIDKYERKHR